MNDKSSTDTVQSTTSTETLVRLLVAIACADDAVREKHDLIFVQAADRLSTLQSELTRAREREKELAKVARLARDFIDPGKSPPSVTATELRAKIDRALAGGKP